jgi:hypothetical protein
VKAKRPEATGPEVPDLYAGQPGIVQQNFLAHAGSWVDDAGYISKHFRAVLKTPRRISICARVSLPSSSC